MSPKIVEKGALNLFLKSGFDNPFSQFMYNQSFRLCKNCKAKCSLRREDDCCLFEEYLFWDVSNELKKEIKKMGIKLKFSNQILIQQTAMLFVRLMRAHEMERIGHLYEWENYHIDLIRKERHLFDIHYIERLEKRLIKHLKLLGLLPEQVIAREKIKLVQTLKKQLFKLQEKNKSCEVDAVYEKEIKI